MQRLQGLLNLMASSLVFPKVFPLGSRIRQYPFHKVSCCVYSIKKKIYSIDVLSFNSKDPNMTSTSSCIEHPNFERCVYNVIFI